MFAENTLDSIDAPFHKAAAKWYSDNGITGVKPEIKADTSARKTFRHICYPIRRSSFTSKRR